MKQLFKYQYLATILAITFPLLSEIAEQNNAHTLLLILLAIMQVLSVIFFLSNLVMIFLTLFFDIKDGSKIKITISDMRTKNESNL